MKNKAVIVTNTEVSYAGEILNGMFKNNGIMLKPSDKSDIKMWFPLAEIKRIVLPNAKELEGSQLFNTFQELETLAKEYGLEDVQ